MSVNFSWFSIHRLMHVMLIILLLSSFHVVFPSTSLADKDNESSISQQVDDSKNTKHNFYLGAKVGLVYIFGIELDYIIQTNDINRIYLATAVQSSLIVNSFNAGGGFFLGKSGVGLGCRYHHLLWFENEKESKIQPGYGPEVIWNKTIGTKYIINLHAGGIITEGSFFPDISFGVFLPLNR
jgi:hypothetical protein